MKYTIDPEEQIFCGHLSLGSLFQYKRQTEGHIADLLVRKVVDIEFYKYLMGVKTIVRYQLENRLFE